MNQTLKKNICELPDAVANSDVGDLEERIKRYIDPALQYACRSWHTHLVDTHEESTHALAITSALHQFLEKKFLFWLEVLSVLGAVRNAVDALQTAQDWLEVCRVCALNIVQFYSDGIQESPTLDLANDCSRFVNGYFEVISASAQHTYHSALVLAPTTSIVRKLYGLLAHPFVRVVCGAPAAWDLNIAATTFPSTIEVAVWSPCGRFIAITWGGIVAVDILDPVTLQRLQTLEAPPGTPTRRRALSFSPDSRVLTCSSGVDTRSNWDLSVIVWDLQTGGVASVIKWQGPKNERVVGNESSITYSVDGKMIGVFYWYYLAAMVFVYDLASGVHVHTHSLGAPFSTNGSLAHDGPVSNDIWAHGDSLRFATATPTTITILEVGFASGTTATEVETITVPENIFSALPTHADIVGHMEQARLLPALSRLAIAHQGDFPVWDTRNSKPLLRCTDIRCRPRISFSSDGRFLTCPTTGSEIYLWKESPTGYTLQGVLTSSMHSNPLLFPNGEAIVVFGDRLIRLWRTKGLTTPPSDISTRGPQGTRSFVLDFSPDGTLTVYARLGGNVVTVLDLKSGVPRFTINASMNVYGLRVTTDAVVVIGNKKVTTWNLPAGDCAPYAAAEVKDSARTVNIGRQGSGRYGTVAASISPDLHRIAFASHDFLGCPRLVIYSASTGEHLGGVWGYPGQISETGEIPWFTPDGNNFWCALDSGESEVWKITDTNGESLGSISSGDSDAWTTIDDEDASPNLISLARRASLVDPRHPPEGYPWGSSRGYRVTNDGWVLGPDGKRLLMLPPPWRSYVVRRMWNGQFLALLHGGLPEPVILELEP